MPRKPPGITEPQVCIDCKIKKKPCDFNIVVPKDYRKSIYLQSYCKACGCNRHRKSRYNISSEQFSEAFNNQGGVCKLCKRPVSGKLLATDHCHKTKVFRGLLCTICNITVQNHTPEFLRLCADYVERQGRI